MTATQKLVSKLLLLICLQFLIAALLSCGNDLEEQTKKDERRVDKVKNLLLDESVNQVLVVAHRGDWRNAPENSIQAIENSIAMGVDMVEIDVRLTKDSVPVLMHDATIDRTTSGKGRVSDWTLDSLKTLFLRNGANHTTSHKIPTLEEAMLAAKGEVMINLDKCYAHFDKVYEVLQKTGTLDHALMKGSVPLSQLRKEFGQFLDEVIYMPVIRLNKPGAEKMLNEYMVEMKLEAIELIFPDESSPVLNRLEELRQSGARIWVNSLWASLNAGYEDDKALDDPEEIYGWYLNNGIGMIQTDRPQRLLAFLRKSGWHEKGHH